MADDEKKLLLEFVASKVDSIVSTTRTLVSARSPNPPGDVSRVAEVAVALVREAIPECEISTYKTGPGIVNVVARLDSGRPGRRLVFSGHLDTYPTGDVSTWSVPPTEGTLSEDGKRVYGRGTSDMKGGIAASIVAMSALASKREHWNGEIVLALAGDEETMGTLGSAYLLENVEAVRGDAMVCGDAGSPLVVRIGEKGLLWVEISAKGQPAHGAHVHRGINAIDRLRKALDAVKTLEDIPLSPSQEVLDTIDAAAEVSEPLSGAGESDVLKKITVNIGTITGGVSPNLVAGSARAELDIRLPLGSTGDEVVRNIHQLLDSMEGVKFKVLRSYDPSWTSPSEEIVRHALEAAKRVTGSPTVANMRVGASDSRLFRAAGIPSVVVGLTPNNMGGPDEYVTVEELQNVAQIHTLIAYDFLKHP